MGELVRTQALAETANGTVGGVPARTRRSCGSSRRRMAVSPPLEVGLHDPALGAVVPVELVAVEADDNVGFLFDLA